MLERRSWLALTTEGAAAAAARDPVVVLPLAAVEQHGPHLPLSTDVDIGAGLLERALRHLPDEAPVWTLPPIVWGASLEHASFPGTISLRGAQLVELIRAQGAALARCGIRRLVLANSHGGNRFAMEDAALALRADLGMLVVKASYFRFERPSEPSLPDREWRHGLHGGAVETAMMLHLRPERVRSDAIADFPSLGAELAESMERVGPEGQAAFAWLAHDLHPSGAVGDARLATPELGRRLVEHYARALADVVLEAARFPLERLSGPEP